MYDKVLDTFKTAAEEGSFTKAADKLYITHTAVRKQINQLEGALEVKLFDRSNQGLLLTNAGQVIMPRRCGSSRSPKRLSGGFGMLITTRRPP